MIRDNREWYRQDEEGQIRAFREIYKTPRVNTWRRNNRRNDEKRIPHCWMEPVGHSGDFTHKYFFYKGYVSNGRIWMFPLLLAYRSTGMLFIYCYQNTASSIQWNHFKISSAPYSHVSRKRHEMIWPRQLNFPDHLVRARLYKHWHVLRVCTTIGVNSLTPMAPFTNMV